MKEQLCKCGQKAVCYQHGERPVCQDCLRSIANDNYRQHKKRIKERRIANEMAQIKKQFQYN